MLICKTIDGMLAGLVGVSFTYPLDLSKTRLQNQVSVVGKIAKYKNLPDTVVKVFRYEGFKGAYAGYLGNASSWLANKKCYPSNNKIHIFVFYFFHIFDQLCVSLF